MVISTQHAQFSLQMAEKVMKNISPNEVLNNLRIQYLLLQDMVGKAVTW